MTTKTSREIIRNAYFYANIKNAQLTNFYYNTQLLNSAYSSLYTDLVKEADYYIKYIEFSKTVDVPDDCYLIMGVYQKYSDGALDEIMPMPKDQRMSGLYYRYENGTITVGNPTYTNGTYVLKYSTLPDTLTAPDEPELIDISYDTIGDLTDEGFYYTTKEDDTTSYHFYSFTTSESADIDISDYVEYTNEDLSAYAIDGLDIVSGAIDDPYAAVTYSDGSTYIWTGTHNALYNIEQIHGHETNIEVLRLKTDDVTGKGMLYTENGKLYYGSFVPDTVLSYPSQIYFTVIEYKLASLLMSLNGMDSSIIEDKLLPEAEVKLYETMKPFTKPYRISNQVRHYRWQ